MCSLIFIVFCMRNNPAIVLQNKINHLTDCNNCSCCKVREFLSVSKVINASLGNRLKSKEIAAKCWDNLVIINSHTERHCSRSKHMQRLRVVRQLFTRCGGENDSSETKRGKRRSCFGNTFTSQLYNAAPSLPDSVLQTFLFNRPICSSSCSSCCCVEAVLIWGGRCPKEMRIRGCFYIGPYIKPKRR